MEAWKETLPAKVFFIICSQLPAGKIGVAKELDRSPAMNSSRST
jgi:hypothetical protein